MSPPRQTGALFFGENGRNSLEKSQGTALCHSRSHQREAICTRRRKFPRSSFSPLDLTRPRQVWDSNPINSDSWCSVRDLRFPPYIPIPAGGGLQRMAARIRACLSARMYSTSAKVSFLSGETRGGRDEDRHLFTRTMLVNDTLIS